MLSLFFAFACSGNPPTGEPTDPPEMNIAVDNNEANEQSQEEKKPEAQKEHSHSADNADHGAHDHHTVVEPGLVPDGAAVSFAEPTDGATLASPFKVVMNVTGMSVKPAGEIVEGTGHHHIIIDSEPVAKGTAVANDEKHLHFGKGQTETELTLEPGEHTLQLQFANGAHISYGEQLSSTIKVTISE